MRAPPRLRRSCVATFASFLRPPSWARRWCASRSPAPSWRSSAEIPSRKHATIWSAPSLPPHAFSPPIRPPSRIDGEGLHRSAQASCGVDRVYGRGKKYDRQRGGELGLPFVDTDAEIIAAHGPVEDIFAREGEAVFRTYEREVVKAALRGDPKVVSLEAGPLRTGRRESCSPNTRYASSSMFRCGRSWRARAVRKHRVRSWARSLPCGARVKFSLRASRITARRRSLSMVVGRSVKSHGRS